MLKEFSVYNFKNFDKELHMDLSRVNNYAFNEEATKNGVLKAALVYGDNGSGKTNLGYALFDIILHLTDKEKQLSGYRLYGNLNLDESTAFSYVFSFEEGELKYQYEKADAQVLLWERVTINGDIMLEYDFDAHKATVRLEGAETLNTNLTEKNISFIKYVHNNTVLKENNRNNIVFKKFLNYVDNMLWFSSLERNEYQGFDNGPEGISQGIIKRDKVKDFQEFLHKVGIDYDFIVQEIEGKKQLFCRYKRSTVNFFSVASRGTCSLALFYYWLIRLNNVSLVFIDEFDAFYHNNLAVAVVEELKKMPDIQAILTTHNTSIMSNDLLRPDCYLQIVDGRIKSFADSTKKELRKAHNLQKMYNAGAFDEQKADCDNI